MGYLAGLLPDPAAASPLLALMEGLGVYLLGGQYTNEQALDAVDTYLDLLFRSCSWVGVPAYWKSLAAVISVCTMP